MSEKDDRRVRKSKYAIHSALKELLIMKALSDITVSEICRKADINRSTFYFHYSTPEDVFNEMTTQVIDELIVEFLNQKQRDIIAFLRLYFQYAAKHKEIFIALHHTNIYNQYITKIINETMGGLDNRRDYNEIEMKSICYGFFGVVSEWLDGSLHYSAEEIIQYFSGLK